LRRSLPIAVHARGPRLVCSRMISVNIEEYPIGLGVPDRPLYALKVATAREL
jgi:hypothetical protein